MKKVFLLFIVCFMAMTAMAQSEQHLKFMNIPLTGKITDFQWYLKKRGIHLQHKFNDGVRLYKGLFSGEEADIYVYYNNNTKIVYRAKACLSYPTEEIAISHFKDLASNLKAKYITALVVDENEKGLLLKVLDDLFYPMGFIALDILDSDHPYKGKEYTIHIDYRDILNSIYDNERNKEDL